MMKLCYIKNLFQCLLFKKNYLETINITYEIGTEGETRDENNKTRIPSILQDKLSLLQ